MDKGVNHLSTQPVMKKFALMLTLLPLVIITLRLVLFPMEEIPLFWGLASELGLSASFLFMLLCLPAGAFLVTIFKQIVGIKTFGVFLPVLIAIAFIKTGFLTGLGVFSFIVLVIVLVNIPMERWGIQQTSRVGVLLTVVVILSVAMAWLFRQVDGLSEQVPLVFPLVITTLLCERMTRKIDEEGTKPALLLYGSTMLVTTLVYFILSTPLLQQFLIYFPEIILAFAGLNLLVGQWIGVRVVEYFRFNPMLK